MSSETREQIAALKTPPNDAPASEWGALAVSIPDWRWPWPEEASGALHVMPGFWRDAEWHRSDNIVGICTGSGHSTVPDPDHWAWEGWLVRMLGGTFDHLFPGFDGDGMPGDGYVVCIIVGGVAVEGTGRTIGRAAIAAAAALGRWPGGGQ